MRGVLISKCVAALISGCAIRIMRVAEQGVQPANVERTVAHIIRVVRITESTRVGSARETLRKFLLNSDANEDRPKLNPHSTGVALRVAATAFLVVVATIDSQGFGAADTSTCLNQLRSEAVPSWTKMRDSSRSFSGSMTWEWSTDIPPSERQKRGDPQYWLDTAQVWACDVAQKAIVNRVDKSGKWIGGRVYCFNPDYAFTQNFKTRNSDMTISKFGRDVNTVNSVKIELSHYISWIEFPFRGAKNAPLTDIVNSADCQIVSCADVKRDSQVYRQISLTYAPVGPAAIVDPSRRSVTVILDPAAGWRVISDITTIRGEIYTTEATYDSTTGDIGGLRRITLEVRDPNDPAVLHETMEYSSVSFHSISVPDTFYLPGIPPAAKAP
jgi:hypothetical protein